jgi:hypothetical protein
VPERRGQRDGGALGGSPRLGRRLSFLRRCLQVGDLAPQDGDLHVPLGDRPRDHVQRLVGGPHVVAPQGGGRAQQRHVGGGHDLPVKGPDVGDGPRQLAAATHGDDNNAAEDGDGHDEQHHEHT